MFPGITGQKLLEYFTRTAEAPSGSADSIHSATIKISQGIWEVTSVHVIIGGSTIIATTVPLFGVGEVRYENQDQQDESLISQKQALRLVHGRCSLLIPLIMSEPKVVIGPGQVKSYIQQRYGNEHTLTVTFRRVKD